MWSEFYVATLVMCLTLVVPGFLTCRAIALPRTWSFCCAPIVGVALVALWGQLLAFAHVAASPMLVYGPLLVFSVCVFVIGSRICKAPLPMPKLPFWLPLLFLAFGIILGNSLYISRLTSANVIYQSYDLTQHLNLIQAMADSGHFSSLGTSFYLSAADAAIDPAPAGAFYPAAWHALCALIVQVTGISTPVVINASMFVFPCLVFPLSMCGFLSAIFPGRTRLLVFCSVVTLAFVIFPWGLIIFGPVYPNVAGFCAMPVAMLLFVRITSDDLNARQRVVVGLALFLSVIGLALLHPNTIFTCAVILVPYCIHRIMETCAAKGVGKAKTALICVVFAIVCMGLWYACYKLPLFRDTVSHVWKPYARPFQQLVNIVSQTYVLGFWGEVATQYALAAVVIIGFVRSCYTRGSRWLAASYSITAFICLYSTTQANTIKQIISGFWYTDPMRLASMCCIAAIPLAALGLDWLYATALDLATAYNIKKHRPTRPAVIGVALAGVFLIINFSPDFNLPGIHKDEPTAPGMTESLSNYEFRDHAKNTHTTFGDYRFNFKNTYGFDYPLDLQEKRFVTNVKEIVGDDLVLNDPMDGSFLAYGYNDLRVYYRNFVGFGNENETTESLLIRQHLTDIATNANVKSAVDTIGAKYVIVLDRAGSDISMLNIRGDYNSKVFAGVSSITQETPGFTCVYRSGSMRLYRID